MIQYEWSVRLYTNSLFKLGAARSIINLIYFRHLLRHESSQLRNLFRLSTRQHVAFLIGRLLDISATQIFRIRYYLVFFETLVHALVKTELNSALAKNLHSVSQTRSCSHHGRRLS